MAIVDRYVRNAGDKSPAQTSGQEVKALVLNFAIDSTDDDGSKYRFFRSIPATAIITKLEVQNDAIAGGVDFDLGIYNTLEGPLKGAVKDADALAATVDLSAARDVSNLISGLSAVALSDNSKTVYELAGDNVDTRQGEYDLVLTGNTVGTTTGNVGIYLEYLAR